MSEEKVKTIPEQVAESLSEALMRSTHVKGMMLILATDDNTIWTYGAGDLITKLGLLSAIRFRAREMWDQGSVPVEEEDE